MSLLLHSWPESLNIKDQQAHTPMENALLASESRERTKILECLLAFEKKGHHTSLTNNELPSSGPNMSKAKKLIDIQDIQKASNSKNDRDLEQLAHKMKHNESKRKKSSNRKGKKTLWENDSAMFAK